MFLLKTLNGAEMAPARIFHKVSVTNKHKHLLKVEFDVISMFWTFDAKISKVYKFAFHLFTFCLIRFTYFCLHLWTYSKNHLPQSKTVFRWGWSWRQWTGRILTSSVLPQWVRCGAWRFWSPSMAGGALLITTAATIPETSSQSAGACSQETTCSRQALKVWVTQYQFRFSHSDKFTLAFMHREWWR